MAADKEKKHRVSVDIPEKKYKAKKKEAVDKNTTVKKLLEKHLNDTL